MRKLLLAAFVIAATMAVTNAQQPNIAIGIVRADGFLMPLTMFGTLFADVPTTLPTHTRVNGEVLESTAPVGPAQSLTGRRWTLARGNGGGKEIRTLESSMREMPYCSDRLLWRTTVDLPPVDPGVAPVPKLGLAVSGADVYLPQDALSRPDDSSRRVAARVVELFLEKESARLSTEKGPYAASLAPGIPAVVIQKLFRHRVDDRQIYYFEAVKALKLSDGAIAGDGGLVTGWVVDSAPGLTDHEVVFKVNDDAYKENERAIVRGIVPYDGRMLWILEWHGWEHEYYSVHEWPRGTLLETINAYDC